jgi:hypothetical protein
MFECGRRRRSVLCLFSCSIVCCMGMANNVNLVIPHQCTLRGAAQYWCPCWSVVPCAAVLHMMVQVHPPWSMLRDGSVTEAITCSIHGWIRPSTRAFAKLINANDRSTRQQQHECTTAKPPQQCTCSHRPKLHNCMHTNSTTHRHKANNYSATSNTQSNIIR